MRDSGPTHLIYITDLELQCNLIVSEGQLEHINYASHYFLFLEVVDLNENILKLLLAPLNLLLYNMYIERIPHFFIFLNDKYM